MEVVCNFCGNLYGYKGGKAHFNRNEKHYCSIRCLGDSNKTHGLSPRKNIDKRYKIWGGAKKRAKIKGFEFDLEIGDVPEIPSRCPILGIEIKENDMPKPLDSSPSLDRIDTLRGYVKGNIRIISNRANRIKSDATLDELKKIVKDLEKYERMGD